MGLIPYFAKQWFQRATGMYANCRRKGFIAFGRLVRQHATTAACRKLQQSGPVKILVDSSVLAHAITHESAWIPTGIKKWGTQEIETGYAARVPVHADTCDQDNYREIRYLPGIAHVARLGHVKLFTSAELDAEQFRQPIGRFHGYYLDDLNLFAGLPFTSVDGRQIDFGNAREKQLQRVAGCTEPLFRSLLSLLGERNSLDAYHIHTAEKHGMDVFLHLDLKLDRLLAQHRARLAALNLRVRVQLPRQCGEALGILPMDPRLLSYEDATFFVRTDLHLPEQKRRRPAKSPDKSFQGWGKRPDPK